MAGVRRGFLSAFLCLSASLLIFSPSLLAKNVILIIGDGMDDQQITIARNYLKGARGRLAIDQMALRSAVQVLTVSEAATDLPVYVADSANSATAMATGHVTSRGRIATSAGSDQDLPTILELAHAQGLRTGVVTTSSITDATPSSFMAHINLRKCEDPSTMVNRSADGDQVVDCRADLKSNGGRGSISEQIAESTVDVFLGGGLEHFDMPVEQGGRSVLDLAQANGYRILRSLPHQVPAADTAGVASAGQINDRWLGLFAPGHLQVRWRGSEDRKAERPAPSLLNRVRGLIGNVTLPEPMTCEPNPGFADTPPLVQMTRFAIDQLKVGELGFVLVVESASIDKQSHQRRACGQIGELQQLDEAVALVLEFAAEKSDTLVLVTADHGQAAQLIPDQSLFSGSGVPIYSPGYIARLRTPEGALMAVNYATNDFFSEEHTGVQVPLFANEAGVGAIPTLIDQHDLYGIMMTYLGLDH